MFVLKYDGHYAPNYETGERLHVFATQKAAQRFVATAELDANLAEVEKLSRQEQQVLKKFKVLNARRSM